MTDKQSYNRYGILIGNNYFPEDQQLSNLQKPIMNILGLHEVFMNPDCGGFTDVRLFANYESTRILRKINEISNSLNKQDLVLIYYSGHGLLNSQQQLFLATSNTEIKRLEETALAVDKLISILAKARAGKVLVILDCSYSGAIGGIEFIKISTEISNTIFIMTATSHSELANENHSDNYSIFTKYIIQGLKTGQAAVSDDGLISADDIYEYSYQGVLKETKQVQEPSKWVCNLHDRLIVAQANGFGPTKSISGDCSEDNWLSEHSYEDSNNNPGTNKQVIFHPLKPNTGADNSVVINSARPNASRYVDANKKINELLGIDSSIVSFYARQRKCDHYLNLVIFESHPTKQKKRMRKKYMPIFPLSQQDQESHHNSVKFSLVLVAVLIIPLVIWLLYPESISSYRNKAMNYAEKADSAVIAVQYKGAVPDYNRAINYAKKASDQELLMDYQLKLAKLHIIMADYKPGLKLLNRVFKYYSANNNVVMQATTLYFMGKVYTGLYKYDKAIDAHKYSNQLLLEKYDANLHPITIDNWHNLGIIRQAQGQPHSAIVNHSIALAILFKTLVNKSNSRHDKVAMILHSLGRAYYSSGDYLQALKYLTKALKIRKHNHGDFHLSVSDILNDKALVLVKTGDYWAAIQMYKQALQIIISRYPNKRNKRVAIQINLGNAWLVQGYLSKAGLLLSKLEKNFKVVGLNSRLLQFKLFNNLGILWCLKANYQKSLLYFEKALKLVHGHSAYVYEQAEIEDNIGIVLRLLGKLNKAKLSHQKAYEVFINRYKFEHPRVAVVLNNLANVARDKGEYKLAEGNYRKAISILEGQKHKDYILLGRFYNNMGSSVSLAGKVKQAIVWHNRAKSVYSRLLNRNHKYIICTNLKLGIAWLALGNILNAEKSFLQVAKSLRKTNFSP